MDIDDPDRRPNGFGNWGPWRTPSQKSESPRFMSESPRPMSESPRLISKSPEPKHESPGSRPEAPETLAEVTRLEDHEEEGAAIEIKDHKQELGNDDYQPVDLERRGRKRQDGAEQNGSDQYGGDNAPQSAQDMGSVFQDDGKDFDASGLYG